MTYSVPAAGIHPYVYDPSQYTDEFYDEILRQFDRGPERLSRIEYETGFKPITGKYKQTGTVVVRPELEKNRGGPIGSYRMADWQPASPVADAWGRVRYPESMRPTGDMTETLDEWGNRWSGTKPQWAKVDGKWHNVSGLLWAGRRSGAASPTKATAKEVQHASGYSTVPQTGNPGEAAKQRGSQMTTNKQAVTTALESKPATSPKTTAKAETKSPKALAKAETKSPKASAASRKYAQVATKGDVDSGTAALLARYKNMKGATT
jgi:hypothetical protein